MHHADQIIEGLAVDWQARVARLGESLHERIKRCAFINGHDVDPRHHHIVDPHAGEFEQIDHHRTSFGLGALALSFGFAARLQGGRRSET